MFDNIHDMLMCFIASNFFLCHAFAFTHKFSFANSLSHNWYQSTGCLNMRIVFLLLDGTFVICIMCD